MDSELHCDDAFYHKEEHFDPERTEKLSYHYHEILKLLGEDAEREGLLQTPLRVAKAMQFLTQGYQQNPEEILRSALFKEDYRQMVIVKDIEIYSMCEHHMLPFVGRAHVAYIPNGYITGLSKIARVVDAYARRLQVQERLTREVCDALYKELGAKGVIVYCEADHMCMKMRGVEKENSSTATIEYCGVFDDAAMRQEFFSLLQGYKK